MKGTICLAATIALLTAALFGCKESVERDPGLFQLRIASDDPKPGWIEVKVRDITKPVYVSPEVAATGADVKKASVKKIGSRTGKSIIYRGKTVSKGVAIEFTDEAAKRIEILTTEHRDERLAILVGNRVVTAQRITMPLKDRLLIWGNLSDEDCEGLVALINEGEPPE